MLHGEVFDQNCSEMPWFVNEEKKVFAYPPPFGYGRSSERAPDGVSEAEPPDGREPSAANDPRAGHVGANLKNAIIEIKANELIPDLVTVYNRDRKDQDILSVLALLMKDGGDKAFARRRHGTSCTARTRATSRSSWQARRIGGLSSHGPMAFYKRRVG